MTADFTEDVTEVAHMVVHVHVDNIKDMADVVKTQEVEAAHYASLSFPLPQPGNVSPQVDYNQNVPVQLLNLDPLRKRAVIALTGNGSAFLCHSQQQAQSLQFGPTQNADEAALVAAPFAFVSEATGPLWAVLAAATVITLGALTSQSVTGAANATTTNTIPAAGAGLTDTITALDYVFSAASLNATTLIVQSGADVLYQTNIATGALSGSVPVPITGLPGQSIVITLTAGGAAITSTLNATYQQQISSPTQVTVGVLAERRNP